MICRCYSCRCDVCNTQLNVIAHTKERTIKFLRKCKWKFSNNKLKCPSCSPNLKSKNNHQEMQGSKSITGELGVDETSVPDDTYNLNNTTLEEKYD